MWTRHRPLGVVSGVVKSHTSPQPPSRSLQEVVDTNDCCQCLVTSSDPSFVPSALIVTFAPSEDPYTTFPTFGPTDDPTDTLTENFPFLGGTLDDLFPGKYSPNDFPLLDVSGWTGELTDIVFVDSLPTPLRLERIIQTPEQLQESVLTGGDDDDDDEETPPIDSSELKQFMEDQSFVATIVQATFTSPTGNEVGAVVIIFTTETAENGRKEQLVILDELDPAYFTTDFSSGRALAQEEEEESCSDDLLSEAIDAVNCGANAVLVDDLCVATATAAYNGLVSVAQGEADEEIAKAVDAFDRIMERLKRRRLRKLTRALVRCLFRGIPMAIAICLAVEAAIYIGVEIATRLSAFAAKSLAIANADSILAGALSVACQGGRFAVFACVSCDAQPTDAPTLSPSKSECSKWPNTEICPVAGGICCDKDEFDCCPNIELCCKKESTNCCTEESFLSYGLCIVTCALEWSTSNG